MAAVLQYATYSTSWCASRDSNFGASRISVWKRGTRVVEMEDRGMRIRVMFDMRCHLEVHFHISLVDRVSYTEDGLIVKK